MKLWLTCAEIAELALPGLPATKRGMSEVTERHSWERYKSLCRPRDGRGGGIEYHIDLLPSSARAAYVAQQLGQIELPGMVEADADNEPEADRLSRQARDGRDARLAIIHAANRFAETSRLSQTVADFSFCSLYSQGKLDIAPWIKQQVDRLTPRTLRRWRKAVKQGSSRLGVDRGASRRGSGIMEMANGGYVRTYTLALIVKQPHLSADHVRELLVDRFGSFELRGEIMPVPPVRTIQAALQRWRAEEKVALTALTNPDAFKSRYRASGNNSDANISRLNEEWQIDASPVDALCIDGRYSVYAAIDLYSRRVKLFITRTPRASAVGLLLRRCILDWGVPERIKTDNGSDFVAKSTVRFMLSMGIETVLSPPFSPEKKAFVERVIGTFQRDMGPLLPGFIGHSVADRKVIEERRAFAARLGQSDEATFAVELNATELQAYVDRWADERYQHRPHAGIGGATPFAAAAAFQGSLRRIDDQRALDILLAPLPDRGGIRIVGKQGIRVDGNLYLTPTIMPETPVLVRMDPADLGRAWLFTVEGDEFLTEAVCPQLAGIDPVAATMAAKKAQKDLIESRTAEIRAEARKIKPRDMADAVLRQAAQKAGKLVELPRRAETHSTPALQAAAEVLKPAPVRKLSAAEQKIMAEIEADLAAPPARTAQVRPLRTEETSQQRYRRYRDLKEAIAAGATIPTEDAIWFGSYGQSSECKTMDGMYADFGEAGVS